MRPRQGHRAGPRLTGHLAHFARVTPLAPEEENGVRYQIEGLARE